MRFYFSFDQKRLQTIGLIFALAARSLFAAPSGKLQPAWTVSLKTEGEQTKVKPASQNSLDTLFRKLKVLKADERWDAVLGVYEEIRDRFGSQLIKMSSENKFESVVENYQTAERFVQQEICSQPELVALFKERSDFKAEALYHRAVEEQSLTLAKEVTEKYFCTSWGDEALELQGDLLFQQGRFEEAIAIYRRLVPNRFRDPFSVQHASPSVNAAAIYAKRILAEEALGRRESGADEKTQPDLKQFAEVFPDATGKFLGRPESAVLETLKKALEEDHFRPENKDQSWSTFAGSNHRSRVVGVSLQDFELDFKIGLTPSFLPQRHVPQHWGNQATNVAPKVTLSLYPAIEGDFLWVHEGKSLKVYHLKTGVEKPQAQWMLQVPTGLAVYSLSVHGTVGYLLTGQTTERPSAYSNVPQTLTVAALSAFSLEKKDGPLWTVNLPDLIPQKKEAFPGQNASQGSDVLAQGAPVTDGERVFYSFLLRSPQAAEEKAFLFALNAADGKLLWRRHVGDRRVMVDSPFYPPAEDPADKKGIPVFTLEGGTLYYAPNNGLVAAVNAETGAAQWATLYASPEEGLFRAKQPPIAYDGLLVNAPGDSRHVFALKSDTGELVWRSQVLDTTELTKLIGIQKERVFFAGTQSLSAVDLRTGYRSSASLRAPTEGEGFIGGSILWLSTNQGIQGYDVQTLLPVNIEKGLKEEILGGNITVTSQYLVTNSQKELGVYRRREQAREQKSP